jgi:serine/threonine protein kinase
MALGKYDMKEELGRGSFGAVFRAVEKKTGKDFAIKQVENFDSNRSITEVSILKRVSHDNIIQYVEWFISPDGLKLCIVMEFANKGTLENVAKKEGCRTEGWCVWRFLCQMSHALNYLHTLKPHHILHRDLKPANILGKDVWDDEKRGNYVSWKIADFGIAKLLNKNAQGIYYGGNQAGTCCYMAPEVCLI